MIYRVKADYDLFRSWQGFEQETRTSLLSNLVQNDTYLTTQQLNEAFDFLHQQLKVLSVKYNDRFLAQISDLRDQTASFIADLNLLPLSDDEFEAFRTHCPHHSHSSAPDGEAALHLCSLLGHPCGSSVCAKSTCPL